MSEKPAKIEVGQWWANERPVPADRAFLLRIERVVDGSAHLIRGRLFAGFAGCESMLSSPEWTYLGCGEHPGPSAWLVETCAKHAYRVTLETHGERPWAELPDEPPSMPRYLTGKAKQRSYARAILTGEDTYRKEHVAAVLSLADILRETGRW